MLKRKVEADSPPPTPPGVPPDGNPIAGVASEKDRPPPYGTAVPAGPGDLPRVVDQLARAGAGQSRFRVACHNYQPRKVRYILTQSGDASAAKSLYLKVEGLDKELERLKKLAGAKAGDVEEPDLVATELPD